MLRFFVSCVLLLAGAFSASGLVLWGLDNSANQSDPGTGAPWGAVAKVVNSDGSLLSGSAVYLGDGFLLTANHVTMNLTYSFVTFDELEFFSIDPAFNDGSRSYGKQVAAGVDMAVFKLTSIPVSATAATLLTTATESFGATSSATLIGWGVGRDPAIAASNNVVTWGDSTTSEKRWGVNAPRATGTNPYDFLVTYAGTTNAPIPANRGLGDSEAAATLYDSGSGLFQQITNQWYLIGLTTAVETNGTSNYGADSSTGGDANYFARISSYDEQITALVPEPTIVSLLALAGLALAAASHRRFFNRRD